MRKFIPLFFPLLLAACDGKDTQPTNAAPTLSVNEVAQHPLTSMLTLTGTATDDSGMAALTATVGGQTVTGEIGESGMFSVRVPLRSGQNDITVTAIDTDGETVRNVTSVYFGERVAAGGAHSGALRDGQLYTWGRNNIGQTGLGFTSSLRDETSQHAVTPQIVSTDTKFTSLSFNQNFSVAIAEGGTVYTWGDDSDGQLGRGNEGRSDCGRSTENCRLDIAQVPMLEDIVQVSAGYAHTVALDASGKVYTFGANNKGQMGSGNTGESVSMPQSVSLPAAGRIVQVEAASSSTYALDENGVLWGWGENSYGNLGQGEATADGIATPTRIDVPGKVKQVASGRDHILALTESGEVYGWGLNFSSQVGYNGEQYAGSDAAFDEDVLTPTLLSAATNLRPTAVYANGNTSYLRGADGKFYIWGMYGESEGEGRPDYKDYDVPMNRLNEFTDIEELAVGALHYVARTHSGDLLSWGWSFEGSLGAGSGEEVFNTWMYNTPLPVALP